MTTKYKLLKSMLEDMETQSHLYKPTSFWEYGSKEIIQELEEKDIKDFRRLKTPRTFFVPGYSHFDYLENINKYDPIKKKLKELTPDLKMGIKLDRVLTGENVAFSDYRVLKASNIDKTPYTDKVSESKIGNPLEQFTFDDRRFSRSFLNYLLGLNFIKQYINISECPNILEIGGGFGSLGEILLGDERNRVFYINADIPPVAFVSSYYLEELFGSDNIANYDDLKYLDSLSIDKLKEQYKALNLCSWQIPELQGTIDLFVNFISFQEMEPDVVDNYCHHIDRLESKYILLRNILEGKRQKNQNNDLGVMTPVLGNDYDSFLENYELIASDSSVFGFTTEDDFHSELRLYKRM